VQKFGRRLQRSFFAREVDVVARDLLGRVIAADRDGESVAVRLTEVEAYAGLDDPASHAFRGRTPRTSIMFGPAGHLYTYFVYGMHWCANIVTGADGDASAVLLRAGELVNGVDAARLRRQRVTREHEFARGPA
jgi:DNA-3-methyladenine glycosylase